MRHVDNNNVNINTNNTEMQVPEEIISANLASEACVKVIHGKNHLRNSSIHIFPDRVIHFCKGSSGHTLNLIRFSNRPYITSDREPSNLWTVYISASPRHMQLENLNQDEAAEFTRVFEESLEKYQESKVTESDFPDDFNDSESRRIQEKEGQELLNQLTRKWKKEGSVRDNDFDWLPSTKNVFQILLLLLFLLTVHSTFILFTSSYTLSSDKYAIITLAKQRDRWAVQQLASSIDKEENEETLLLSLSVLRSAMNDSIGTTIMTAYPNVQSSKGRKGILKILINSGMSEKIIKVFKTGDSLQVKQDIIDLTGELSSAGATLLLRQLYNQSSDSSMKNRILIVLSRKGDTLFIMESFQLGTDSEREQCIDAALSLPPQLSTLVLENFLKNSVTIKLQNKIQSILGTKNTLSRSLSEITTHEK